MCSAQGCWWELEGSKHAISRTNGRVMLDDIINCQLDSVQLRLHHSVAAYRLRQIANYLSLKIHLAFVGIRQFRAKMLVIRFSP